MTSTTIALVLHAESSTRVPVSRTELVAILVIIVAGFAARFSLLNELAIEHFDEGVYASNLFFPDEGSVPRPVSLRPTAPAESD